MTTRSPVSTRMPAPSAPRMRGFGTDGSPFRTQRSRWFSDAARSSTSTSPARRRGRRPLRSEAPPGRRPHGSALPARAQSCHDHCRADPARRRTRPGRDRRRAGRALRGDGAPHSRAEGARSLRDDGLHDAAAGGVVPPERYSREPDRGLGGALLYDADERCPGEGRLARYAWSDGYAELREKLDALGRRLGGVVSRARRRQPAHVARGCRPRRRRLLRQEHADDHPPPRLVGRARDARHGRRGRGVAAARRGLRVLHAVHRVRARRARWTSRARSTATRCLPYWSQAAAPIPEPYRSELGDTVYGCDICQDVCPWNRGVEKRRSHDTLPPAADGRPGRVAARPTARSCADATTACTCRATTRAGCGETRSSRSATAARPSTGRHSSATRQATTSCWREHARWALERIEART